MVALWGIVALVGGVDRKKYVGNKIFQGVMGSNYRRVGGGVGLVSSHCLRQYESMHCSTVP